MQATTAAQTIFNLFFRFAVAVVASMTHTHHWPRRLSGYVFYTSTAAALATDAHRPPSTRPSNLPSLLHDQSLPPSHSLWRCCCCCCGNQCTYVCALIPARTIASARLLARVFAFGHLFYFLFIFSTMRQAACVQRSRVQEGQETGRERSRCAPARPMCVDVGVDAGAVGAVPLYIFIYFIFHSRTHTIRPVKNGQSQRKNEEEVNNVQRPRPQQLQRRMLPDR